jgi:hypothetical protein
MFTYHPRSTWVDPRYPVKGPAVEWAKVDTAVIHYTADDDVPNGDVPAAVAAYLRNIQYSYVTNRGYSIGYLFAVDQTGAVWQLRGWEFKSAANAGHNDHTFPILMLVDGNDRATWEAIVAVRWLIGDAQKLAERALTIVGHGDIGATACPGVGLRVQVKAGVFTPAPEPAPLPVEEDDVKPVVTTWEGEGDEIVVFSDPSNGTFKWRGAVNGGAMVAAGIAVRGGAPLTQAQKAHPTFIRVG